jgi:hypothetical protein
VPEDPGRRKLLELAVDRLVGIRRDRGDIYQATRSSVPADVMTAPPYEWPTRIAGLLTRASVRFTAATSAGVRVEAILGGHHFVPFGLKCRDYLVET